jgi:hypothetical protein
MKLLKIITFYIGTNIIGLPKIITHSIFENKNKKGIELVVKQKIY